MYKVLIAEDELLIRIGIKMSCDWQAFDMTVAADVSTGREAWDAFLEHRPELVLADIRMPEMDGIELIRRIRGIDEKCQIIIISCLEDFSIIQQAMRHGVSDYLLKLNITPNEIHAALAKAKQKLDQTYAPRSLSKTAPGGTESPATSGIRALFTGGAFPGGISAVDGYLGFHPAHCLMLHVAANGGDSGMKTETLYEMVYLCMTDIGHSPFAHLAEDWHVCLLSDIPGNDAEKFRESLSRACAHYGKLFSHKVAALCPACPGGAAALSGLYKDVLAAYAGGYWCKEAPVLVGDVSSALKACRAGAVEYLLRHELLEHILPESMRGEYARHAALIRTDSVQVFEDGLIDMVSSIMIKMHGHIPSDISDLTRRILSNATAFDAVDACMQYIEQTVYASRPFATNRREIRRALQYISRYYASNITLSDIAAYVGLSGNYFSNLFKKETGMTFVAYLNHYRVQKAEALIKTSDLYAYQIAEQCGFSDETYFSRIFKQVTGVPPSVYGQRERGEYEANEP